VLRCADMFLSQFLALSAAGHASWSCDAERADRYVRQAT
jgi:hypothetical protein